jgi:opacity protein-like surface antigen
VRPSRNEYVCNLDVVKQVLTINLDISFPGLAAMAGVALPLGARKGMKMARLLKAALIGASIFVAPATAAIAADMPEAPVFEPPAVIYGGWYLRGYIGMTNQDFDGLEHPAFGVPDYFEWVHDGEFDSGLLFGAGLGYTFNQWFRVDVTGEYRGKTDFSAMDRYSFNPDPNFDDAEEWGVNEYDAKKSEWLFLANAYLDLGEWHRITPYVGAGIGASYNTISGFTDSGFNDLPGDPATPTGGFAGDGSEWQLAWALHAGLAFKATKNLTIDVGYSFLNLGDGKTGTFTANNGACGSTGCHYVTFKDIISHDVKIGFRWEFGGDDYEAASVNY